MKMLYFLRSFLSFIAVFYLYLIKMDDEVT